MDMFRQIAPKGIVNKQPVEVKTSVASLEKVASKSTLQDTISSPLAAQVPEHGNGTTASYSDVVKETGGELNGHEPAEPFPSHDPSEGNLANGSNQEGDRKSFSEATAVNGSSVVLNDVAPLSSHEPAGPLLPHESSPDNLATDDLSEEDVEFMDAREHPILASENATGEDDKKTPTGEEKMVHSYEVILKTSSDTSEKEVGMSSSETNMTPTIVLTAANTGQSEEDVAVYLTKIERATTDILENESVEMEEAQINAAKIAVQADAHVAEAHVEPGEGEAVAVSNDSVETVITHEEMGRMTPAECPFFNSE